MPLLDLPGGGPPAPMRRTDADRVKEVRVGAVSHFFDSGSFTLWTKAKEYAKKTGKSEWDYYDTDEHWKYLWDYAAFVKRNRAAIDLFANVDVIGNPELTLRNQEYLEGVHGLDPVPVVHFPTDPGWVGRYLRRAKPGHPGRPRHDTIALGGMVGSLATPACRSWVRECFRRVCDPATGLPRVKVHGFGVTDFGVMREFPWYSVDSSSWTKIGAFGGVLVPPHRGGRYVFTEDPYNVKFSLDNPKAGEAGKHYLTLTAYERKLALGWLEEIGIPLGRAEGGAVVEYGVLTRHSERKVANMHYYERFAASLPAYPWAWRPPAERKGLGLVK